MILVIGAGLSGLLTAYRLKQNGIPFKVLEARNRIGGRVYSVQGQLGTPMEMGATWFTDQHSHLQLVLNELGLKLFNQYNGDHYYYYSPGNPNHGQYALSDNSVSYRISGGTGKVISELADRIGSEDILLDHKVRKVEASANGVRVISNQGEFDSDKVVVTIPPKIWASQIEFFPGLPDELISVAGKTQTWMEDSTKAALEYSNPFWRNAGSPSIIVGNYGPFVECYDHTTSDESGFALCGFLNPAFNSLSKEDRLKAVIQQLQVVYGEVALEYSAYHERVWQEDEYTKAMPGEVNYPHQNNGHAIFRESYFEGRLFFSGTETASSFPGYMEGAVVASNEVIKQNLIG